MPGNPPQKRPAEPDDTNPDLALARLLIAAKEDATFRRHLCFLLRAPALQRQSLVNTGLHEMALRGEPPAIRTAFALLAKDECARAALVFLDA